MPRSEYEVMVGLALLDQIEALDRAKDFNTHLAANILLVQAQQQVEAGLYAEGDYTNARLEAKNTPHTRG